MREELGAKTVEQSISLSPWEELTGRVETIEETDGLLLVRLSTGVLAFDSYSTEAGKLRTELENANGSLVSILRTDLEGQPLLIDVSTVN